MPKFSESQSYLRLKELGTSPFDLTEEGALSSERIASYRIESVGLELLYATERVDDDVIEALWSLAEERDVIAKMKAMQEGEVINRIEGYESEERRVLHTAMRDFFDTPHTAKPAKEAAELAYAELEKLKAFLEEIDREGNITDVVQIGIGGSYLGPEAIYKALYAYHKKGRKVHFLSNVDPDDAAALFQELDLSKTLIVVVSKSGTTLETRTNEALAKEYLQKEGLNPQEHLVAITGKGSPMDDPSQYRGAFYIWDYIGGRYSVTSMIGAFSLAFVLGMDRLLDFLKGAHEMDKVALSDDRAHNLPLFSALLGIWNRNFLDFSDVVIIPYSNALSRFSAHLQQLDMESNGKHIDTEGQDVDFDTGPIIWGEPGTNGQHSFYQSLHQGTTVVPFEFIGFRESQYHKDLLVDGTNSQEKLLANLFAQAIALAEGQKSENPNKCFYGNRPSRILLGDCLDPFTMGAILSYYENKVAFQGFIWGINSFDQEGVQLGKVLANKLIDHFAALRDETKKAPDFPEGEAYLSLLRSS